MAEQYRKARPVEKLMLSGVEFTLKSPGPVAFFRAFEGGFPSDEEAQNYFMQNADKLIRALVPEVCVSPRVVLRDPKEGELALSELDPVDGLLIVMTVFEKLIDFDKMGELSSFREDGSGSGGSSDSKDVWDPPK